MFTVEERADGTVGLAEAYTADGEPRVLNLILDTTVALLGATAAGFHGLERTDDRAFRWTTGEARIDVPIDRETPPAALDMDGDGIHRARKTAEAAS